MSMRSTLIERAYRQAEEEGATLGTTYAAAPTLIVPTANEEFEALMEEQHPCERFQGDLPPDGYGLLLAWWDGALCRVWLKQKV